MAGRPLSLFLLAFALITPTPAVFAQAKAAGAAKASDAVRERSLSVVLRQEAGGALKRFYAGRDYRPLWAENDRLGPAAGSFISFIATAQADGLKPGSYNLGKLRDLVRKARSGDVEAVAKAELALSDSFVRYVVDQRRTGRTRMIYADKRLKPGRLKPEQILRAAALAGEFPTYIDQMAWMSPQYVRLRLLMANARKAGADDDVLDRLRRNLDRARLLPGPWTMHIVVDASSAQLWYYQGGKQLGTMKVVVGAQETQTPLMAGMLQWAILNPYWHVPTYLARNSIAPKILAGRSLASMRMQVLSDGGSAPHVLDPKGVDWNAVASGRTEILLRELPGGANSMGAVKFLFPNDEGIYLHDTPNRDLFGQRDRHLSNGCVRLEDAGALGQWLLRRSIATRSKAPEQYVPLAVPVPVYLTYLTATATENGVAFRPDIYGLDN